MTTLRFSRSALLAISLSLLTVGGAQAAGHSKKESSKKAPAPVAASAGDDLASVKSQLKVLEKALAVADAQALAELWTADCSYTNEDGQKWVGRDKVRDRFASVFGTEGRQLVELVPENVKVMAPAVALAEGVVRRRDFASTDPSTRFSMLLLKQADGNWLISSATETPYAVAEEPDRLGELSWLVGDWKVEKESGYVHLNASWAAGHKFLILSYIIKRPGQKDAVDCKQIIGWNPRTEQIVSWSFDANGGFGYGAWSKKDKQWVVDADGVERDGSATRATNIVSMDGPDSFTWQSINRSVDGASYEDTAVLKIVRAGK